MRAGVPTGVWDGDWFPSLGDAELAPEARAVFDDIRAVRGTDYVNNFWRALAHDPAELKRVWEEAKAVMAPGRRSTRW